MIPTRPCPSANPVSGPVTKGLEPISQAGTTRGDRWHGVLLATLVAALPGPQASWAQSVPSPDPDRVINAGLNEGAALLSSMRVQARTGQAFEGTIQSYSEGGYRSGERTSQVTQRASEMRLWWRRPHALRVEILQSDNAFAQGITLVTRDLVTCRVKAGGVLGFLGINLAVDDPRLRNNRNYSLRETNPKGYLDRTLTPGAVWRVLGSGQVGRTPVRVVEVTGVRALDGLITRELLEIDPVGHALRKARLYEGERLVAHYTMSAFRWLNDVSDHHFND